MKLLMGTAGYGGSRDRGFCYRDVDPDWGKAREVLAVLAESPFLAGLDMSFGYGNLPECLDKLAGIKRFDFNTVKIPWKSLWTTKMPDIAYSQEVFREALKSANYVAKLSHGFVPERSEIWKWDGASLDTLDELQIAKERGRDDWKLEIPVNVVNREFLWKVSGFPMEVIARSVFLAGRLNSMAGEAFRWVFFHPYVDYTVVQPRTVEEAERILSYIMMGPINWEFVSDTRKV